jgi:hypothetical protein
MILQTAVCKICRLCVFSKIGYYFFSLLFITGLDMKQKENVWIRFLYPIYLIALWKLKKFKFW